MQHPIYSQPFYEAYITSISTLHQISGMRLILSRIWVKGVTKILAQKIERKMPLWTPRHKQEDNSEMDLKKMVYEGRDWIHLPLDRNQWQALANTSYIRFLEGRKFCKQLLVSQDRFCSLQFVTLDINTVLLDEYIQKKELAHQINLVPYLFQLVKISCTPDRRIEVWIFVSQLC